MPGVFKEELGDESDWGTVKDGGDKVRKIMYILIG